MLLKNTRRFWLVSEKILVFELVLNQNPSQSEVRNHNHPEISQISDLFYSAQLSPALN
jgi:hypothetical protein